jgi:hypothetical protein
VPLYYTVNESDGPITQGMGEVFAEHLKEVRTLEAEWQTLRGSDLDRLNASARSLSLPAIVVPDRKK